MSLLVDAHAHLGSARELAARKNVLTLMCGTEPESAKEVLALRSDHIVASCALHPWQAGKWQVKDMLPYLLESPVLGEIGLDSEWTDVDMALQRAAFIEQLDIAKEQNKPVVLHTKGMEGEIARILKSYPLKKLVHWYSCGAHLPEYIEQDCYFTVGPDYASNPHVQALLRAVPLSRLLTETDGMDAVSWALGRAVPPEALEAVLRGELNAIAMAKGIALESAQEAVYQNLLAFLKVPE